MTRKMTRKTNRSGNSGGKTGGNRSRNRKTSNRKTGNRKSLVPKNLRRKLRNTWNKASLKQRIGMIATTLVATVAAIAIIAGLIRFVGWRVQVSEAKAAQSEMRSLYDFNPGNIISDGAFFNGNALSERQVQTILDQQGATCTGDKCLKTMTFTTQSQAADEYCQAYKGGQNESAAAIIYKAGNACGISQKVLLTVLQKEQHLLTVTDPSDFQFKSAMGLSCPDDANCDAKYAGFFNQVYGAAKRYQYYVRHESQYAYHAGALNYVRYNPNAGCGGSDVYIENKATALLYIYTPYQPNEAALKAGAGEGDACSTYGNRNFAIIYNSMFGNPRD